MKLEPTSYTINKVVPFKDSVQEYLKSKIGTEETEKYVTNQLPLLNGGVLTDIRYSWLSNGSKFEVIHTKTGFKIAAWNFGAVLHDFDTTVACVTDLPSVHGKPPIIVVGLDCELTGGMICFFDINSSRVIRAIQIDDKVSSIHVVNAGNDLSLPGALRALDGVLAIGTHRGKVLLMDICRQICDEAILNGGDRIKDEINSCHLTCLSLCDLEHLEYHKERSLKNEDHICIQLNPHSTSSEHFAFHGPDNEIRLHANMVEVAISALFYCPQLGSLLVGFNFGAFQLYNLSNMELIYTSPVYDDCIPITHFAVQEPCDDPRAYCYVWVVYNTIEKGDKTFPMAVMYAFAYNNKDFLEGYGHLYQEFVSCSVRFQMELQLTGLKNAIGAKCLSLQSYSKALAPRQGAAPFIDAPEEKLALCNIVWTTWNSQNNAVLETYFCLFDLNQWYKEQMPGSTQLADTDCNSYISCVSLSKLLSPVSQFSCNNDLLDIRINPNTFSQFVCSQRLEEHYFPSALGFQGVIARGNECVWFTNSGVQRHLLMQLEVVGSLGLIRPTELFQRCLDLGLTPIYTDVPYGNSASTSLKIQRELILNVALEHQLVRWLCQCGRDWANGSQSGAGCTLDLLLNWAWQRANVLKFQSDKLCIPLFDHTGSRLDANAVIQLNHCACQLKNLTILFEHVAENFSMYYSEQDIADICYQTQSLQMISTHLEVLHWLLNVGLLPECPLSMYPLPDETERVSAPYPAEKLSTFYQCKRKEFYHLQNPDEEEFLPQSAIGTSCDLLFIDNLIDLECNGKVLRKQWESDCGNGLYPPPSLQALLRAYFIEDIDIVHKHCLFIYVFLDLAMTLDQSRYKSIIPHLIKFPAVFKINPSIIKITQAFWQLDHGDFSTAMTQLLDPSVNNEDLKPWHHRTLLKALLIQGQHQHALLYQQVRKPPVSSIQDICITTTLLIVNDLVQEAFHFQRQHRSIINEKEILLHFFQTCDKMSHLQSILHLPLSPNEEQEFLTYLNNSPDTKVKTLLVVYYLQRAQYGLAFAANDLLNNYGIMKQGLLGQQDRHFRNVIIAGFHKTLPAVTQKLLDFCKSNKPKSALLLNAQRPNPMSVYIHDATEQAKYKSTLIQASFMKARETWKQRSQNETPFIFNSKIVSNLPSSKMNSSLIYPTIVETSNKSMTVEHDITEDVTPAKRQRLSSRNSINNASLSCTLDTSVSRRTLSCYNSDSLLSTPIVKRRSYRSTSVASNILDSFAVDTPASILKVRSFIRNSQSPETGGNSTTPEILEEDQNSETEMVVQSTSRKIINLDSPAIKRRSSLRITPRKSISRTPHFGVHFEDGRRPNSQSSNESGENFDVQKMEVCIEVHREQTPDEPINDDPSVQLDSKNSSRSTDDVFYSPKQSLSFSDQKSSDVSAISSSLSEPKELSKISGISSLESNSFDDKDDKRVSLKRKSSDSVRSRRSYRNNPTSTILQETISPVVTELKTPEVIPKLMGRKSLTRQVLENNLKMKVLSTPSFKQLFLPQTDKDITILKNTTEVINIHTTENVTEETHSVTTTETKNEVVTTKNEQELEKIHSFNESYSKFVTKISEMTELDKNVVPTLERSHILSSSSDVSDSDVSHLYEKVSGPDVSCTTNEDEQHVKKITEEAIEVEEDDIEEKISDQSDDEEEQVNMDVINEKQNESDKVEVDLKEQEIEEQSESDKEESNEAVNREDIEEQSESDKITIEEDVEEESEDEDELISNSDEESEEEVEEQDIHSDAENNVDEEEEELLERMVIEEEDSEPELSNKSSTDEEDKESYSSGNSSDVIEIKSTSEESSRESYEGLNAQLDDKLVDIERIVESSNEEDEENVEKEENVVLSEMQNVYSNIYDDLDEIADDTNVLERNITISNASAENVKKTEEETEYLQYASEEIMNAQENQSLMNQDYEENMQAIEEITDKENAEDFVVECIKEDMAGLVEDTYENRSSMNKIYEENIQVVQEVVENENVVDIALESVNKSKEKHVDDTQENESPMNQDYVENMQGVEEVTENENVVGIVLESGNKGKEKHVDDTQENKSPMNQDYEENMQGVKEVTENENVVDVVLESGNKAKEKHVDDDTQENKSPMNQDYEENMQSVEEVTDKENVDDVKSVKKEEKNKEDEDEIKIMEENIEKDKEKIKSMEQEVEEENKQNKEKIKIVEEKNREEVKLVEERIEEQNKSRVLRRLRSNSTTESEPQDPTAEGRHLRRTRSQSVEAMTDHTKTIQIPRKIGVEHKESTEELSANTGGRSLRRTRSQSILDATESTKPSHRLRSNSTTEVKHTKPTPEEKSSRRTRSQSVEADNTKTREVRASSVLLEDIPEEEITPKKKRKTRRTSSVTSSPPSTEGTPSRPRRRSFTLAQQAIHITTGTRRRSSSRASSAQDMDDNFSDTASVASVASVPVTHTVQPLDARNLRHRSLSPNMLKKELVASPQTPRRSTRGLVLPRKTDLSNISEEQSTGSAMEEKAVTVATKKSAQRKQDTAGSSHQSQSTTRRRAYKPLESYLPQHAIIKTRKSYKFRKLTKRDPTT